jgi:hypothetical protein
LGSYVRRNNSGACELKETGKFWDGESVTNPFDVEKLPYRKLLTWFHRNYQSRQSLAALSIRTPRHKRSLRLAVNARVQG